MMHPFPSRHRLFQATGWRLTLLNAIVFCTLLLSVMGTLYVIEVVTTNAERTQILTQTATRELGEDPVAALRSPQGLTDAPHHPFSPAALQAFFVLADPAGRVHKGVEYQMPGLPDQGALHAVLSTGAADTRDLMVDAFHLRLYSVPVRAETRQVLGVLQVYVSLDGRDHDLQRLQLVLCASCLVGMLIVLLASRVLAMRALAPLQRMVNQQDQFVADASHELRTPLALLQADVEILQRALRRTRASDAVAAQPERDSAHPAVLRLTQDEQEVVEEVAAELRHMNYLIADLLALATYDAGKMPNATQPVCLAPLLTELAARFRPQLTQAGVTLHLLLPADARPLVVEGDASALRRLVLILLTNASAYTPMGGQIWLEARVDLSHQLELTVRDTGRGIAAKDLPHVFTRFYRADKARGRQLPVAEEQTSGGTGLGLAIAQSIVERHQGAITASSPGEGQGSAFTVTLKPGGHRSGRGPAKSNAPPRRRTKKCVRRLPF